MPPLSPSTVEVLLSKLDEKTSEKLVPAGGLTTLQNLEMNDTGRYDRRSGTVFLDTVTGASRIHSGERELLVGTADTVYADLQGVFTARGSITSVRSDHTPINVSSFEQLGHDFLRLGGYDWHVWQEGLEIHYAVLDSTTGAYVVVDGLISSTLDAGATTLQSPRIIQGGPTTVLIAFMQDGGGVAFTKIYARKIDVSAPTVVSAESTVAPTINGWYRNSGFDVTYASGTTVCFAYMVNPAAFNVALRLDEWNTSTMASSATLTSGNITTTNNTFVYLPNFFIGSQASGYTLALALAANIAAGVLAFVRKVTAAAGLGGSQTHTTIYAGTVGGETFTACTGEVDANGDTQVMVCMDSTTASARAQLWRVQRTSGGVNSGPFIRYGFRLMSKIFAFQGSDLVLASAGITFTTGQEDRTYYLIEISTGSILGRALGSLGAKSRETNGNLPLVTLTSTEALIPSQFFVTTVQEGAALVRFRAPVPARWLEIAGVTLIPGSSIYCYDGAGLSELGFYHPPGITGTPVVGAVLPNGTYYYRATWAWTDAVAGRLQRSDPSEAIRVVTSGGNKHPRLTVETLNATLKSAPVQQAALELWRTTVNPSAGDAASFFLVTTIANDPAFDTQVIDDSTDDVTIAANERLYTLGNIVLGNTTPPPANCLTTWNNRVWAAERDLLWFSKEIQDSFGVSFADTNFIQVSDDQGDIVAIANAGQRLGIWKGAALYVISGDGPDDTGKGAFSPLRRLPVPLGARSAVAVISTELGVFFQDDASGQIWLLPPDGDPIFIGREIADTAPSLTITDMVVVPDKRQVRIFSQEGTTLVYDLINKLWTVFTDQDAVAAAVVDGVTGYVNTNGRIHFDDAATWAEGKGGADEATYTAALETGWISPNSIAGYARLYAVVAVGELLGDHELLMKLRYRFDNGTEDESTPATTISEAFGYRIEGRPQIRNQQASAFRVRLEDDASETAGFGMEGLNATIGVRPGRQRIAKSNIGTPP
jgi:hypothetical protein